MSRRMRALAVSISLAVGCTATVVACSGGKGGSQGTDVRGDLTVLQAPGEDPVLCSTVFTAEVPSCAGIPISPWDWGKVSGERDDHGVTLGTYHLTGSYDGNQFEVSGTPKPAEQANGTTEAVDRHEFDPACSKPDVVEPSHGVQEWEALSQDYGRFEIPKLVTTWETDPTAPGTTSKEFVGNVIVQPGAKAAATDLIRRHYKGGLCVVEQDAPTQKELQHIAKEANASAPDSPLGQVVSANVAPTKPEVQVVVWLADAAARKEAARRWGKSVVLRGLLEPTKG